MGVAVRSEADWQEREIEEAAFAPMRGGSRRFWMIAAALAIVVVAAAGAYAYQLSAGLGAAGYDDTAFWGVYEANLVTFIGVSYGGALVSAVLRLLGAPWRTPISRIAEAMALVTLLVGASFAIIHLGNPVQAWRLLITPRLSSPIVWDFYAVCTYLFATIVFLYLPLVPDFARVRDRLAVGRGRRWGMYRVLALGWRGRQEQRERLERAVAVMSIVIIPLAVAVHSVLAWAFSMTTRPGWHSTIFAPYFVIAALYSGVALVIVVAAGFRRAYHLGAFLRERHFVNLARIMAVLGGVYLYLTIADLLTAGYAHTDDEVLVVAALLQGTYAPAFWLWLAGGLLVPIAVGGGIGAVPQRWQIRAAVAVAALAVAGMAVKRLLIVLPGAGVPEIGATWGSAQLTWVPVLITLGAFAAIPLALMLLFRFIPILAIDEMVRVGQTGATRTALDPELEGV